MKTLQIIIPMYLPMSEGGTQIDSEQAIMFVLGIFIGLALGFIFGFLLHDIKFFNS